MGRKTGRRMRRAGVCLLAAVLLMGIATVAYMLPYSAAGETARQYLENPAEGVTVRETKASISFIPERGAETGLILYPGAKVDSAAYAPVAERLAEKGVLCVVVKMPLHFALLRQDAADAVRGAWPEVQNWYIGGHSLGGVAAGMYLEQHAADYSGLVLLASYVNRDLSGTELRVLSICGSEDGVMNAERCRESRSLLPAETEEYIIDGGNHAGMGDYGPQKGDNPAAISGESQAELVSGSILEWLQAG